MKKTFILVCIVIFFLLIFGCELDDDDDMQFFYTEKVVNGSETGGETNAAWYYRGESFAVIMTRWDEIWLTEPKLTKSEADLLKDITEFTLTLTPVEGTEIPYDKRDDMRVEKFHAGHEVVQRFYFTMPRGSYTLVGTTTDTSKSTTRTDTINLTVK
ncbi:MAG: hypothetical protein RBR15_15215 [Sphaerochaeta sp.]|nr:hypothetical protein [Sphaerochaeta sp.]